ncbi:hypothetical protein [Prauserella cavernicola]|uniref:G domain-containing protein n=1 Tax=Prauserella cavernicola TaxID=2800127 RepID=A0A934QSR2_9PSEU|nr:hypothetical protein [Prauserella cavernicola]MBK1784999.1 hypothetical protein [Prauserella cavernicola]
MNLPELTWSLLNQALEAYGDSPRATNWLRGHLARFTEPVRIAVAGPHGCGRSTLVNAIAGEDVAGAGTDAGWHHVQASRSQAELMLLDPPPLDAEAAEPGAFERVCMDADAVLYLMGHPHNADLSFLRTVQDHPVARAAPVNALVVLSRADELGGGRVDALISARQVARRYRRDTELSGLCQDIVPVAGLAAGASRSLTEADFETVAALAAVPKAELEPLLLSADRFAADPRRQELLARFGLFGVRLATTLVRGGVDTQSALTAQLSQRTGFSELRDSITRYFTDRRHVLKARSALIGLEVVLRMEPRPAAAPLLGELERLLAGAHEFAELRVLAALRAGRARLPEELKDEALRLIGGYGDEPAQRLGVEGPEPQVRQAALGALRLWQEYAENPVFGAAERQAALTVVRSCEAMAMGPGR